MHLVIFLLFFGLFHRFRILLHRVFHRVKDFNNFSSVDSGIVGWEAKNSRRDVFGNRRHARFVVIIAVLSWTRIEQRGIPATNEES